MSAVKGVTTRRQVTVVEKLQPRVSVNGSYIECDLPGWSLNSFTRTGKLALWEALRVVQMNGVFAWMDLPYIFSGIYSQRGAASSSMAVTASAMVVCSPHLYDNTRLSQPMTLSVGVDAIGTTSMTLVVLLKDKSSGKVLLTEYRRLIYIDTTTRKATKIPENIAALKARGNFQDGGIRFRTPNIPEDADVIFARDVKVKASDCDTYYHTNSTSYVRFLLDATFAAEQAGKLKWFGGDIGLYDVREVNIRYTGESFPGDTLHVELWQHDTEPDTLHYRVYRTGKTVLHCTMSFTPGTASRL